MKLGVFLALFGDRSLDEALERATDLGLQTVEIGTGNYPGSPHLDVKGLLGSKKKREELLAKIEDYGLEISALSCHGNPLHPDKRVANEHHKVFVDTVKLAAGLGVKVVNGFSGCPGGSEKDRTPNWIVCPWPPDFEQAVAWQWEKKVIPYWKQQAKLLNKHKVKFAVEMHPGFVVYNTETMRRLHNEAGKAGGANFDPSHLFWQGMDPLKSLRMLEGMVYHVHAKDCIVDEWNTPVNGVLDTKPYGEELGRSWIFRTVGYGHGKEFWTDFVSMLRMIGYDGPVSIEHEDSLMSAGEGLSKAVAFLKEVLLFEKPGAMWWA